jgi:type I restriction enzyme R subunit
MTTVGQIELLTQKRVISLFQNKLHYKYLGNWEDRENNTNIEKDILRKYLSDRGYNKSLIDQAINELTKVATNQNKSLYDINKEVYSLLRYGVKVKKLGEKPFIQYGL